MYEYMHAFFLLNYIINVINIVQRESVYKYFTSAFTFFQSSCGMVCIVKNCHLLNLHFVSPYDLLHLIYC